MFFVFLSSIVCIEEYWYPFPVDQFNKTTYGPLDFSRLNDKAADKRIIAKGDHFAFENGTTVRFFATNFVFGGNFINHSRAEIVAKKLASQGINLVRFHHADSPAEESIWTSYTNQTIDPEKLDRMHYLIYQLKINGIYSNINLHVSRKYPGLNEEFDSPIIEQFTFGKAIDQFYDEYIELQKEYAIDLLTSVNKYTGYRLADDPCVAFVELNNENTIFNAKDFYDVLKGTKFEKALLDKWHEWLLSKYGSYEGIKAAWNSNSLNTSLNIAEGIAETYERHGTNAPTTITEDGFTYKHVETNVSTNKYVPSFRAQYSYLNITNYTYYTVQFKARCNPPGEFSFYFTEDKTWRVISTQEKFNVTQEWNTFTRVVKATENYPGYKVRSDLDLPSVEGTADFADVKIFYGREEIEPGEDKTVDTIPFDGEVTKDVNQFLIDTETKTHKYLMNVLYNDIKLKSISTGSQSDYGSVMSLYKESTYSNYTDTHFYFQHPTFDADHGFETDHFYIENTPLINDSSYSLFSKYGINRVVGKPLSVSEINMPFPNEYQHELFPVALAGASWQDVSAIYQYKWDPDNEQSDYVTEFFSFADNPALIITSKAMAYAYRKRYIKSAEKKIITHFGLQDIKKDMETYYRRRRSYSHATFMPFHDAIYYTQFHDDDRKLEIEYPDPGMTDKTDFPLETEQIEWVRNSTDVFFKTVAPSIRIMSAFMYGEERQLGDVTIKANAPKPYTTSVIVEALDDKPISESESIIVVVASTVKNNGSIWDSKRTTTNENWGHACAMHLYVDFEISIPGNENATIYRLTPNGETNGTLKSESTGNGFKFSSTKETASMWYHITRKNPETPNSNQEKSSVGKTVGIVIGVIAGVAIIAAVVAFFVLRNRKNDVDSDIDNATVV